jgi:hypothetical protein
MKIKNIAPIMQIVNDKANPNVQTRSPAVQKLRKLGTNTLQLSSKYEANVVFVAANTYQ